jgi:PleD family two-component response regulator
MFGCAVAMPGSGVGTSRYITLLLSVTRHLLAAAKVDPLTGICNRRSLKEVLNTEIARSLRGKLSFTVIFCDIDHFKLINDEMGHANGDVILRFQKYFKKPEAIANESPQAS